MKKIFFALIFLLTCSSVAFASEEKAQILNFTADNVYEILGKSTVGTNLIIDLSQVTTSCDVYCAAKLTLNNGVQFSIGYNKDSKKVFTIMGGLLLAYNDQTQMIEAMLYAMDLIQIIAKSIDPNITEAEIDTIISKISISADGVLEGEGSSVSLKGNKLTGNFISGNYILTVSPE